MYITDPSCEGCPSSGLFARVSSELPRLADVISNLQGGFLEAFLNLQQANSESITDVSTQAMRDQQVAHAEETTFSTLGITATAFFELESAFTNAATVPCDDSAKESGKCARFEYIQPALLHVSEEIANILK